MLTQRPIRAAMPATVVAAIAALMPLAASGQSAAYPTRPISVIVGLQAATGSDIAVRTLAERLSPALGQPLVIENLPGAGGVLAAQRVARATPDGYTFGALSNAVFSILPNLDSKLPYEPFRDFAPAAFVAAIPSVIFLHPAVPARNVKELVELARKSRPPMSYASGGVGSVQHLATELFRSMAGVELLHVPFKGSAQATLDVVAGRVDWGIQGISTVLPHVKAGKLRIIAWTGAERGALYPDLPTVQESGLPDFTYEAFVGLYAPAGTSREVLDRVSAEVRRVTSSPELRERWLGLGLAARNIAPEQMMRILRDESTANAKLIRERGIKAE
jgi:tripartite-type tricarboxylate transporter receptor subunit TctC